MDATNPKDTPRTAVYVTSHGRHYHRPGRHRHTGSGKAHTTLGTAAAAGYVPCTRCFSVVSPGRDPHPAYLTLARAEVGR